ncbi:hypothetical protein [uncultured Clostridium sp.]|uniref:hypothetical protein n=1 Tax=uncultured Clostridium sp. TaxID=59620 RepID=UPI00262732CB|nr:hypothetical protein [uncultured Clostridium sp.]
MQKDDIDEIIKASFAQIETVSNLDKCNLKRAMREKDNKRGMSIWWVPLFGATLSVIAVSFLAIMVVTDNYILNKVIFEIVQTTRIGFVIVFLLTVLGMFKFNLKEEARL